MATKRVSLYLGLALSFLFCAALGLGVPPAAAQARSVVVDRRDADMRIEPNGDVQVRETWQVRFIGGPFRFAFRSIPLNRVEAITDWGVSEGAQPYGEAADQKPATFTLSADKASRTITWYFEPTSDGARTFALAYTLHGALRIYPAGDQFFWTFVESDRQYPITASQVTVSLPASFPLDALRTQTYMKTVEAGAGRIVDGRTVAFTGGPFASGAGRETRVQFPHGAISAAPPAWQERADRVAAMQPVYNLVSLVLALLILVGGGLGLYLLWYTRGRDRTTEVATEFYPRLPEDIPPGMAGTLLDERADLKDLLATVVDLARRGYLQIVEIGLEQAFALYVYMTMMDTCVPTSGCSSTRSSASRSERDLEDLKTGLSLMPELRSRLYDEVVAASYFTRNPQTTRMLYTIAGIGLAIAGGVLGVAGYVLVADYAPLAILVVIALVLVGIFLAILGQFMPGKTPKGAVAAAKWRAFKRYLQQIDRYTEVAQAEAQFDTYLPYAIAFGVEKEWVRDFQAVDTPAPTWYRASAYPVYYGHPQYGASGDERGAPSARPAGGGSASPSLDSMAGQTFGGLNAMSAGLFSMLNTASSTFTSAPQSSSGGFSGGGGGGGGSSGFG